jgi:hypothetical protein
VDPFEALVDLLVRDVRVEALDLCGVRLVVEEARLNALCERVEGRFALFGGQQAPPSIVMPRSE